MYAAEVIYKAKFKRFKVMGVENTSYRPRVSIHYSARKEGGEVGELLIQGNI